MITFEEALEGILSRVGVLEPEELPAEQAVGLVLADNVLADIDIAPFDNSAMDGYAVHAADLSTASAQTPVVLRVIDHIAAGSNPTTEVVPGAAARIMTGAPIPPGADTVVMVERCTPLDLDGGTGGSVSFAAPAPLGEHVRLKGEDVKAGEIVLAAGETLTPVAVGLLASVGVTQARVFGRPRVGILVTGDEIVDPAEMPGPGRIRNSNGPALAALVAASGCEPVLLGVARDNEAETEALLSRAPEFDAVVSTGGVSMGDFDVVRTVLDRIGVMEYWQVAVKPGKPQAFGGIGGTPFFGLPGNPGAAAVGFELFVRPALRKMRGCADLHRPRVWARLTHDVRKGVGRRHFLRAVIERDERHATLRDAAEPCVSYRVSLAGRQSSAMLSTMHRANCLISLPAEAEGALADEIVECIRLDVEEGTP